MPPRDRQPGFSLVEVGAALLIIAILLAVLIPMLSTMRSSGHLQRCADHQAHLSELWNLYLHDHGGRFPFVAVQPGWHYGGARFSSMTGEPLVDLHRPLNEYVAGGGSDAAALDVFRCPADSGISHADAAIGTGRRTAFRSFGTSFRANAALLNTRSAGLDIEPRGLMRREITASSSRLVLLGDPVWYEVFNETGREASWHGDEASGNLLFLDGSVRFETIKPATANQPVVFDPGVVLRDESSPPPPADDP